MVTESKTNPCLSCGACCSHYRVTFYWAEGNDAPGGFVPVELTLKLDILTRTMKGTEKNPPRCIALQGEVGVEVSCSVYENRPTVCREFNAYWENGLPNQRCDEARLALGLQPLKPDFFDNPDDPRKPGKFPKAA